MRVFAAILAVFALLVQASLPWVSQSAVAASRDWQGSAGIAALSDTALVICGAHLASQEPTSVPGKLPLSGKPAFCPICLALHLLNSAVPPTNTIVLAGSAFDVAFISVGHESIAAHSSHLRAQPRAPPTRLT